MMKADAPPCPPRGPAGAVAKETIAMTHAANRVPVAPVGNGRRDFLRKAAATGAAASLGPFIHPRPARAARTLRIMQWHHFVLSYDNWFYDTYVKEWGQANDVEVIVDRVAFPSLPNRAEAEVAAKKGHDLFMFTRPPAVFEDDVIDHAEIYQECERRFGKPIDLAIRSTYNPKTKKHFGFADSYVPDPVNYRKDLWDGAGIAPTTWDDVLRGGRLIKQKHGIPVGIGISPEIDSGMALRAILYSFGGSEQDANGNLVLKSKPTLAALRYVKALYQDAMTPEVLTWDSASNNNAMLAGGASLALNAISLTRTGENQQLPVTDRILLARAARGPARAVALPHMMNVYAIWKFASNVADAKKFLVDYVGNFRQAFAAGSYYNFPSFPATVPDLRKQIASDPKASPPNKYAVLDDVLTWTVNVGYPGHTNAAVDEIFNNWVLNEMFAKAATGADTPERALDVAHAQCEKVWAKWRARGKL
jgi:multiple sugar transport system substrate-binding protein